MFIASKLPLTCGAQAAAAAGNYRPLAAGLAAGAEPRRLPLLHIYMQKKKCNSCLPPVAGLAAGVEPRRQPLHWWSAAAAEEAKQVAKESQSRRQLTELRLVVS